MQVPLLSGVGTDERAEFVTSYPVNLEPIPVDSKISKGQLRGTAGAVTIATGPGTDRGGISWNDQCFRVMGTKLVRLNQDNTVDILGDVGGEGPVTMDYSFDRLGIRSGDKLFYWDGTSLTEVTDEDLGPVIDMIWIDSYWMTTDGNSVVVTELADATSVLPLKYGSAEADPDMVTGLIKFREEAYVCGRHTIQVFQNVGGNGFPFATLPGGTIPFGCVGAMAKTLFAGAFAFVGSARNEALGVYIAGDGTANKISTRAVDDALAFVADPSSIELEKRVSRDEQRLFVHLPDETWVYLANASQATGQSCWYRARSGSGGAYRLRHAVNCYSKTIVGDTESGALGELSDGVFSHFGDPTEWRFDAGLIYGQSKGGIIHSVELVGLPGRGSGTASIFFSMTRDGESFSTERTINIARGERGKRMQWRPHSRFSNWMGLRFRGFDEALPGFAALEVDVRGLAV